MKNNKGFTLIEVLLALAVIAIGLGALLRASVITIQTTQLLKEKSIKHWVAMQGIAMIQLGLLELPNHVPANEKTIMLNQTWYWRAISHPTPIPHVDRINVSVSSRPTGPFTDTLHAFRYQNEA